MNRKNPFFQNLTWESQPEYVLVIKDDSNTCFQSFNEIVNYLIYKHDLIVYVEEKDFEHELLLESKEKNKVRKFLSLFENNVNFQSSPVPVENRVFFGDESDKNKNEINIVQYEEIEIRIDFIICLGGNGALLHASSTFQKTCPPVISIHSGSLGFLCPFSFSNYEKYLGFVIKGDVPLLFRNRLKCQIKPNLPTSISNGIFNINNNTSLSDFSDFQSISSSDQNYQDNQKMISLNEIVIGRGGSSYICNLELFVNDYLITTIQGDGVIISTPTGTTAYAMAAGASMSHPSLPAIIITPICPHSLSFRPINVPAGVHLKIQLSHEARATAWVSVDGSSNKELLPGNHISITTSRYPLPSICRSDQINDWFEGLATCLNWNKRKQQLSLNSCYLPNKSYEYSFSNSEGDKGQK